MHRNIPTALASQETAHDLKNSNSTVKYFISNNIWERFKSKSQKSGCTGDCNENSNLDSSIPLQDTHVQANYFSIQQLN